MPGRWSKGMLEKLEREEKHQSQSIDAFAEANRKKIFALQEKLDKLLEGYLDNLIDEDTYKRKKENLVQQKIALKSEKETFGRKADERVDRTNVGMDKCLNLRGKNRLGAISARDCSFCAKNWNEPPHFRKKCLF